MFEPSRPERVAKVTPVTDNVLVYHYKDGSVAIARVDQDNEFICLRPDQVGPLGGVLTASTPVDPQTVCSCGCRKAPDMPWCDDCIRAGVPG